MDCNVRPDDMQRITTKELADKFIDEQVKLVREQVGDKKVLLALSGGVDSSVAAYLVQKAGYQCIGTTMQLHDDAAAQIADAKAVCDRLGMDFCTMDLQNAFRTHVQAHFVAAYENGLTPNPCVDCNRRLKFGALLEAALELGCDYVVTGHYCRIEKNDATDRYQHDSDKIALFFEDNLVADDAAEELTSTVYARYKNWCIENGCHPEGMKNFKQGLQAQGRVVRKRPKRGGEKTTMLLGYRLISGFDTQLLA